MIYLSDLLNETKLPSSEIDMDVYAQKYLKTINHLKNKKKTLLLTTSNRWIQHKEDVPKSTQLALKIKETLGSDKIVHLDIPKLNILPCEGNVSSNKQFGGYHCGTKESALKDKEKNPTGNHRCWCSYNNKNDELWKVSKELFECDAVVFFTSIRWGQANSFYQKLIERLNWLESRHATLGESNIVKNIDAGFIAVGQNWNGPSVVKTQKQVFEFYGFNTPNDLFWNWQYTNDPWDESKRSYNNASGVFNETFEI